jgi:hypothetical protein
MTAIAGFCHEGKVWIGGDSAGVGGTHLVVRADPKVFRNGDFLFGFTRSFRMGQLLRYSLTPPRMFTGQDVYGFMVTTFIDAVRTCLKSGGYACREHETEYGGNFLVGYGGRLFEIDYDYQVGEPMDGYAAVGCGHQIVHGALFATVGMEPQPRMNLALAAAERHCSGVRGPFTVESM